MRDRVSTIVAVAMSIIVIGTLYIFVRSIENNSGDLENSPEYGSATLQEFNMKDTDLNRALNIITINPEWNPIQVDQIICNEDGTIKLFWDKKWREWKIIAIRHFDGGEEHIAAKFIDRIYFVKH